MKAVIVPKRQVLEWWPFPERTPPKTTCLFSDGVASWWVGWYSQTEDRWLADMPTGPHATVPNQLVKVWAHLGNWIQETREDLP